VRLDNTTNPRKVDVYASIDADEIYDHFWKAMASHSF